MHNTTSQPFCPVQCHRCGGRLLQSFVGEQPVGDATQSGQFVGSATSQQGRLHQDRRPATKASTRRGDVSNPGGAGQLEFRDRGERLGTRLRPQVADVVGAETEASNATAQDGLTPVIITW